MINNPSKYKAFSMVELLLAIAVVAVVAAIIAPNFLRIQKQAKDIVASNMAADLNSTYGEWLTAGGQQSNTTSPTTANGLLAMNGTDNSDFVNGGNSANFKFPLPASVLSSLNPTSPLPVNINGVAVYFDPTTQQWAATSVPTDGSAVQVGGYAVCTDPATGNFFATQLPSIGQVAQLNNNLISVDPTTGKMVSANASSLSFQPATWTDTVILQGSQPLGVPQYVYGVAPPSASSYSGPQWYQYTYTADNGGGMGRLGGGFHGYFISYSVQYGAIQ